MALSVSFEGRFSSFADAQRFNQECYAQLHTRNWWCGAPLLTSVRETARGAMTVGFDWPDEPRRQDDRFMAARELSWLFGFLARYRTRWRIWGAEVNGVIDPDGAMAQSLTQVIAEWGGDDDETRATAILTAHAERHDGPVEWTSVGLGRQAAYAAALHLWADLQLEPEAEQLTADLVEARHAGLVRCGVWRAVHADDVDRNRRLVDRAALELELTPIAAAWREISVAEARKIVTRLVRLDQAYGTQLASPETAEALADRFLAGAQTCFTNGHLDDAGNGGSTPVGPATLEAAVAFVDGQRVGLVWIGDED
jgi:hypothetical protein